MTYSHILSTLYEFRPESIDKRIIQYEVAYALLVGSSGWLHESDSVSSPLGRATAKPLAVAAGKVTAVTETQLVRNFVDGLFRVQN